MSEFCILLAAPRSGTQLLGAGVGSGFNAIWLQEIFHELYGRPGTPYAEMDNLFERSSFFNFRASLIARDIRFAFPSTEIQREIFARYLDHLRSLAGGAHILIDVKYNSWHHLNDYWANADDCPLLAKIVMDHRISVVHVTRRNLFSQYCSIMMARQTGVWHASHELPAPIALTINPQDCANLMDKMERRVRTFEDWFSGYPMAQLAYEDIIANGEFTPVVKNTFGSVFGDGPVAPLQIQYRKILPSLPDVIANGSELLRYFNDTPYSEMVSDALTGDRR
ncbi:hypothetical protein [Bauldia litoralis]|uniref:Sulfotransferase family protein n=1 Tax=Bauldia litoralis TaxID=665467 RepID=A0A1G6ENV5_9HYPH|nr:hypothetical protein [Bauldia litoralis]SDB59179.1 Sulfotransferase family protein [Bauldia litoralis]